MPPISERQLEPLFQPIGQFVLMWGLTEAAIVGNIAIVYHKGGGREISKILPVAFGRRMDLLKECCKKSAPLKPFAAELLDLRTQASALADFRDALAHGQIAGFDPRTGVYTFMMYDTNDKERIQYVKPVPVTVETLHNATVASMHLSRFANDLNRRLLQALVVKHP